MPDSNNLTLMQDKGDAVEIATYLNDGKIMLKIEKLEILRQCSSVGIQITKKRSHDKL